MNFDFIFLIRKETRTFFQRFFCGLPLHSFCYLSKSRDALAERIKIFSNFLRIKNWQNFAFFIFWRQSHQSYIVWPPPLITTYINHKPISLLEKKTTATKTPHVNYYARMDLFTTYFCGLVAPWASCAGFDSCDGRGISQVIATMVRVKEMWITAPFKLFVANYRERARWTRKYIVRSYFRVRQLEQQLYG